MKRLTMRAAALIAATWIPSYVVAQQSAESARLSRAITAYENFQVETAMHILDTVIANTGLLTPPQVVSAYKYAGAAHAVIGDTNSSIRYFREAIKRDTSVSLEPSKFSATEISAFQLARLSLLQGKPDAAYAARSAAPAGTEYGRIRIGSPVADAFFYVNGQVQGPIGGIQFWKIPAGVPVSIAIRSAKCAGPWDTTLVVKPGAEMAIGRRVPLRCSP